MREPPPRRQADARRGAAFDDDLSHGGAGADVGAGLARRVRDSVADGAHAADRMSPDAGLAVHLAKAMMQEYVSRSRGGWRGEGADDAVEREGRLDGIVLEPFTEEIGGAFGEQIGEQAFIRQREAETDRGPARLPSEPRTLRHRRWAAF